MWLDSQLGRIAIQDTPLSTIEHRFVLSYADEDLPYAQNLANKLKKYLGQYNPSERITAWYRHRDVGLVGFGQAIQAASIGILLWSKNFSQTSGTHWGEFSGFKEEAKYYPDHLNFIMIIDLDNAGVSLYDVSSKSIVDLRRNYFGQQLVDELMKRKK